MRYKLGFGETYPKKDSKTQDISELSKWYIYILLLLFYWHLQYSIRCFYGSDFVMIQIRTKKNSVSDPDSGVFWIRIRIQNTYPDLRA